MIFRAGRHAFTLAFLVTCLGLAHRATFAAHGAELDGTWSAEFIQPVFSGDLFGAGPTAAAVAGNQVYVGGSFTRIGSVQAGPGSLAANGIARWDGRQWHPLGAGLGGFVNAALDGAVNAIAVDGEQVYVAGTFTTAGGEPASRIARWDGERWWPLGPGLNGPVQSLLVHEGRVYAGGGFSAAGDVTLNGVGFWNGTVWSPLGTGLAANFKVKALAAYHGRIYAGGNFFVIQTGGTLVRALAQWDGERWSAVGTGVNLDVNALAVFGGRLVVGGQFSTAGGAPANRIAAWDGAAWTTLGAGVGGGILPAVNTLLVEDEVLIAGGTFTTAGEQTANGLARWNGTQWTPYAEPLVTALAMPGTVSALAAGPAGVIAVGGFGEAGGSVVPGLARWDGQQWSALGQGIGGPVQAVLSTPDGTYVGGQFPTAGGLKVNSITRRRNGAWHALGGGVLAFGQPGLIRGIAAHGSNVYVGGSFTVAGGNSATNVACWNGTEWKALGGGLTGGAGTVVISLATAPNGDLIAGGVFTQADGQPARNVARWNGTSWSALGTGLFATGGGTVQALAFLGSDLVAGGAFNQPVPFLARWDGTGWVSLGAAPDATVLALGVHDGDVFAGGYFTRIGGQTVRRIARWDGVAWSSLGDGLGGDSNQEYVATLNASAAGVFAAGVFTNAGPVSVRRIARFHQEEWTPLGSGLTAGPFGTDPFAYGLGVDDGALLVGGAFVEVGGQAASNVSRWTFGAAPVSPSVSVRQAASGELVFTWSAPAGTRVQWKVASSLNGIYADAGEPFTASGTPQETTLPLPEGTEHWYRLDVVP